MTWHGLEQCHILGAMQVEAKGFIKYLKTKIKIGRRFHFTDKFRCIFFFSRVKKIYNIRAYRYGGVFLPSFVRRLCQLVRKKILAHYNSDMLNAIC